MTEIGQGEQEFTGSHRKRLVWAAVVIFFAAHLLFVANFVWSSGNTQQDFERQAESARLDMIRRNIVTFFRELDSFTALIRTPEVLNAAKQVGDASNASAREELAYHLNQQLNSLAFPTRFIGKIFLIAKQDKQMSFAKDPAKPGLENDELPRIDELEQAGLLGPLVKGNGVPVYYAPGELMNRITAVQSQMDPSQTARFVALAEHLENHIVVSGIENSVLYMIVLQDHFLKEFLPWEPLFQTRISLLDAEKRPIFSASLSGKSDEYLPVAHQETVELEPYGFQLVLTSSGQSLWKSIRANGASLLLIFAGSLGVCLFLAYLFSKPISHPIRRLSMSIKRQARNFPLRPLQMEETRIPRWQRLSIHNKILMFFLVSVILPVVVVGSIYTGWLTMYSRDKLVDSLNAVSRQMSANVNYQTEAYRRFVRQLAVSGPIQSLLENMTKRGPFLSGEVVIAPSAGLDPRLTGVSYYVLYDTAGKAIYSSMYANNLELFTLDTKALMVDEQAMMWQPEHLDLFNQSGLTLVYEIPQQTFGQKAGYLEVHWKENVFEEVMGLAANRTVSTAIVDTKGRVVAPYRTEDTEAIAWAASLLYSQMGKERVVHWQGQEQLAVVQPLAGSDWRFMVLKPLSEVNTQSRDLLMQNLAILAVLTCITALCAYLLSRSMVRPIKTLKTAMQRAGAGDLKQQLSYESLDEIGELKSSFNQMIVQINTLMQENIDSKVREQELHKLKSQAELRMLQQQINPHFLYNTLESINMMAKRSGAEDVSTTVGALARIFRFTISKGPELVQLAQEIEHTRSYMTIQLVRFRSRFEVEWELAEEALYVPVLKFILQPIVENAVNHGIAELPSGGKICISAMVAERTLIVEVRDNGVGMDEPTLHKLLLSLTEEASSDTGIGLRNVYQRLKLYYSDQAQMRVESDMMMGTKITISIPLMS
ncbi:cache domain-containing sensor histidine kinase [Paenibacillus roseipurpureus]|uniref:histidine kinase n=1 Tax=Paenibacillus roseopurpureus TaxID=2918901 RepID=A0AA96LQA9_9BACL|nr:sensor histidine kinase [Paenibacillus sp. MBLB1832]WNR46035.1 sensor histidine kinase [Paenibacillus sp. MBLB1832]